jgi:hypothetical protein
MLRTTTPTPLLLAALATALACGTPANTTSDGSSSTGPDATQGTDGTAPTSTGLDPTTGPMTSATGATTTSEPTGEPTTGDPTGEPTTGDGTTSATSTGTDTADDTTGTTTDTTGAVASTGSTGTTGNDDTTGTTGDVAGLGTLSGDCGLLDAMEVESPEPFVFTGAIDFGMIGFDYDLLTPGGQQIDDEGGLNDGSLYSEIVAYEVLARCDMAQLLKTEGKIVYKDPMGKKTDMLVELAGHKVGVSVVRAVGFPQEDPYTVAQADTILKKKLGDITISSANVAPEDAWVKQILSVVAYGPMHVESILTAYDGLDPALKADTILVVTVTDGDDAFIY